MHKKNKSCEPTHSQDGILGLEQLLYEVSYRRKILCDEGHDTTDDAAEDSYEIIVPRVLATLLRRTRLLLILSGCIFGFLLGDLISRALF